MPCNLDMVVSVHGRFGANVGMIRQSLPIFASRPCATLRVYPPNPCQRCLVVQALFGSDRVLRRGYTNSSPFWGLTSV